VLIVSGTQLFSLDRSDTHSFAGGSVTTQMWTVHWSLIALAVTSFLGIILLVVPKREKTNAYAGERRHHIAVAIDGPRGRRR